MFPVVDPVIICDSPANRFPAGERMTVIEHCPDPGWATVLKCPVLFCPHFVNMGSFLMNKINKILELLAQLLVISHNKSRETKCYIAKTSVTLAGLKDTRFMSGYFIW